VATEDRELEDDDDRGDDRDDDRRDIRNDEAGGPS